MAEILTKNESEIKLPTGNIATELPAENKSEHVSVKKRQKYATDEERIAAQKEYRKTYYANNKAALQQKRKARYELQKQAEGKTNVARGRPKLPADKKKVKKRATTCGAITEIEEEAITCGAITAKIANIDLNSEAKLLVIATPQLTATPQSVNQK